VEKRLKITVVGAGYVGMSLSVLLAIKNKVIVHDIDPKRVETINKKKSTVKDPDIENYLSDIELDITATLDKEEAYQFADFIVVCTPTNYDDSTNKFDTGSVDQVVNDAVTINPKVTIVIKSTVPIGYTALLQNKYSTDRIIFSPEFLREGSALYDNLYPSRIVIGSNSESAIKFANILKESSKSENIKTFFLDSQEAETIKLFSNTYLAMRVAFFNELDSFALTKELDTESIIKAICEDPRIGTGYNNPSFGYGGYCLPKDTKQLLSNYESIPQTMIKSIIDSNRIRKEFITEQIVKREPKAVGFYRLVMKEGSDNIRSSAVLGIMKRLNQRGIKTLAYEPLIKEKKIFESEIINDLDSFKQQSSLIISNRASDELDDVSEKVFSRDIFGND